MIGAEAPSAFHVPPMTENLTQAAGLPAFEALPDVHAGAGEATGKKKRGRAKKYGRDQTLARLSPRPSSSSAPRACNSLSAPSARNLSSGGSDELDLQDGGGYF